MFRPLRASLPCAAFVAAGCFGSPQTPAPEAGPPDMLVIALDTTTEALIDAAMPNTAAWLRDARSYSAAISPGNNTTDASASLWANTWVSGVAVAESDPRSLAERLRGAGYGTVFASSNRVLDHDYFRRDFDWSRVDDQTEPGVVDARSIDAFLAAWEARPSPRFGWIQLVVGHDYRHGIPSEHLDGHHVNAAGLQNAWTTYAADAAETDALMPALFAANAGGLTALVADHGEHFADRGPTLLPDGPVHGHGLANTPMEVRVPLALRGPGIAAARIATPVSTLDLHSTLLRVAGLDVVGGDLRNDTELRPAITRACGVGDQGGGSRCLASLLRPDGVELVRTSGNLGLPVWLEWYDHGGVGVSTAWREVAPSSSPYDAELLDGIAAIAAPDVFDICAEHPELESLGYVDCP